MIITIFFMFTILLFVINADVIWLAGFVLLYIATLIIFGISPMLTPHIVEKDRLIIRQGLYFNKAIPWELISEIDEMVSVPFGQGVYGNIGKPRVVVISKKFNLIRIKLDKKIRFGYALGKLADEIVIDVNETERFIEEINKRIEPVY